MKKKYIVPTIEWQDVESVSVLATSLEVGVYTDEEVDAGKSLANDRRGGWGNLWD